MQIDVEHYLKRDPKTPKYLQYNAPDYWNVWRKNTQFREKIALEQSDKACVSIDKIINHINEMVTELEGVPCNNSSVNSVEIEGKQHKVYGHCLIVKNCDWKEPIWDKERRRYTFYDNKYNAIKKAFDMVYPNDIIWLKFSTDGYLGVVAEGFDINFRYDNTSGKLLRVANKQWDESFVLIVPISRKIAKKRKDIETAIGNYLIGKGVPIIDYFSHNY